MFRLLIKLAVAALLIHAAWRVGSSFWRFYQYEDALQEIAQFGERQSERQLCAAALDKAGQWNLPVSAEAVAVRRGSNPSFNCETGYRAAVPSAYSVAVASKIYIDARYTDRLQVLPGYSYPWDFKVNVSAFVRP